MTAVPKALKAHERVGDFALSRPRVNRPRLKLLSRFERCAGVIADCAAPTAATLALQASLVTVAGAGTAIWSGADITIIRQPPAVSGGSAPFIVFDDCRLRAWGLRSPLAFCPARRRDRGGGAAITRPRHACARATCWTQEGRKVEQIVLNLAEKVGDLAAPIAAGGAVGRGTRGRASSNAVRALVAIGYGAAGARCVTPAWRMMWRPRCVRRERCSTGRSRRVRRTATANRNGESRSSRLSPCSSPTRGAERVESHSSASRHRVRSPFDPVQVIIILPDRVDELR